MIEQLKKVKYTFGEKSQKAINTCHNDLKLILETAIRLSLIDFGVSEGNRSIKKQYEYFKKGLSQIDGITKKGKHNYVPSMAVDYYGFVNGKLSYDLETLSYLAGMFHAVTEMLLEQGKITHGIRWGGNWDRDGEILTDQTFDDRPHIELIELK